MKILTICEGGNCRSVSLAYVFKDYHGLEALSASAKCCSKETLTMLINWADKVILLAPEWQDRLPDNIGSKGYICDIGPDKWGNALHPELLNITAQLAEVILKRNGNGEEKREERSKAA